MLSHEQPSSETIIKQLKRILRSKDFQASESLSSFLEYVVQETLQGHADQIKGYTVAVHALHRPPTFNPQTDTIVRVQARRLRRALRYYYATEGAQDPIVIDIPRGTYVPTFQPNHMTSESNALSGIPEHSGYRPSIVVLLFETLGGEPEHVQLADSLTQSLVVALARFAELTIIGPLTRKRIKGPKASLREIGQRYNAHFVIDGLLRLREDRLRLTVSLIDVATRRTLWADTYDSPDLAPDSFAFEDEVSYQIAATLADHYGVIHRMLAHRAGQRQAEPIGLVYYAILRYHYYAAEFPPQDREATFEALRQAVDSEPDNALLMAMLSDMYIIDYSMGTDETGLEQARQLTRQALMLNPLCPQARFAQAVLCFLQGQRQRFIDEIDQALRLEPRAPDFMGLCGMYLAMAGEWTRGIELIEQGIRLNPHLPSTYRVAHSIDHYRKGRYDEALAEAQRINAPGLFLEPLLRAAVLGQLGRAKDAQAPLNQLLKLHPDFASRGPELTRRWVFSKENVEMLMEGLRKAGLTLSSDSE